jgi:ribosomal protein S18 acetylase RimI-like enzyme
MGVMVRPLAAADRAGIAQMLAGCGAFSPEEQAVALELVDAALTTDDYPHLVAESGGEPAGYICIGPTPLTQSTWHLYWICVRSVLVWRGIGRQLHDAAVQFIRARAGTRLVVETSGRADYAGARAFYRRLGYAQAGEIPDYYRPGDSCLYYWKAL